MIRNWNIDDIDIIGEHENFAKNVAKWIKAGHTSKELCFIWDDGDFIKGGVVFAEYETGNVDILDFSLSEDSFHLGAELLKHGISELSAKNVCYNLYNDSKQYKKYIRCFRRAGFVIAQEKLSYRFKKCQIENIADNLEYRSFTDVGRTEFTKAVMLVTQQTLDSYDARDALEFGADKAAANMVSDLESIHFEPDMWLLAYNDNKLIGLIISQLLGENYGAINYIGVVTSERGKGIVDILLNKGTRLLLDKDISTIIADIDVMNRPMKAALERTGYVLEHEEVVLEFKAEEGSEKE